MDPFATLGLAWRYDIDLEELERRYRELQKALHPDKHVGAAPSQRRLSVQKAVEVNDAYRTLKDELRRAEALLALHATRAPVSATPAADPAFLQEMLELREALGEAKDAGDQAKVAKLSAQVTRMLEDARAELSRAFETLALGGNGGGTVALERASAALARLKYFRRFLDEVSAIEEEALR